MRKHLVAAAGLSLSTLALACSVDTTTDSTFDSVPIDVTAGVPPSAPSGVGDPAASPAPPGPSTTKRAHIRALHQVPVDLPVDGGVASDPDSGDPDSGDPDTGTPPDPPPPPPDPPPPPPPPDPNAGAGPQPTSTCTITKDGQGFFTRTSSQSSYVAYVPSSYDGSAPVRLIVGVHGCGDNAKNFGAWAVNPYNTRASQDHIGISIGGRDGSCWSTSDDPKVLAAVDDISTCFWVHQKKVVIAGYSSGGMLAYRVGLSNASRFAGILIEDSGLYAASSNPDALLANASWLLNVAHLTHTSDPDFTLAKVRADWVKIQAAGFPLLTQETAGTHDGTTDDWANWLVPQAAAWLAP